MLYGLGCVTPALIAWPVLVGHDNIVLWLLCCELIADSISVAVIGTVCTDDKLLSHLLSCIFLMKWKCHQIFKLFVFKSVAFLQISQSVAAIVQVDVKGSRLLYVTDEALLSSSSACPTYIIVAASSDVFLSESVLSSLPTHVITFTDVYCCHSWFFTLFTLFFYYFFVTMHCQCCITVDILCSYTWLVLL